MPKRAAAYADAPALDLSKPESRRMEATAVVENVIGSLIGSVRLEVENRAKNKKARAPSAEGYARVLLQDLKARGFEVREIDR